MGAFESLNRELFHGTHVAFKPGDLVLPASHTGAQMNTTKNVRINRNLAHATPDLGAAKEYAGKAWLDKKNDPNFRARVYQVEPVDPETLREKGDTVSTPYGFRVVKRVWTRTSS